MPKQPTDGAAELIPDRPTLETARVASEQPVFIARVRGFVAKESMRGSSLAPAFLLSMPQMADPNFARSVVLLCKHTEDGAFGLVVNRPLMTSGRVTVNLDPPVSTERELKVWIGGPVEPLTSW